MKKLQKSRRVIYRDGFLRFKLKILYLPIAEKVVLP